MDVKQPDIYAYTDFRKFLRDCFEYLKVTNPKFSHRYLAQKAGFKSPNFFKLVMDNQRNLSIESAKKIASFLKLPAQQARYFETLILFNQSSLDKDKNQFFQQLCQFKPFQKRHLLSAEQMELYSSWHHLAIRELATLSTFRFDAAWIARELQPPISEGEARRSMRLLMKLGLLVKDASGKVRASESLVATEREVKSLAVANFHREMLKRASESIDLEPANRRYVTSLTLTIHDEDIELIKDRVEKFQAELLQAVSDKSRSNAVYQCGVQIFRLAGGKKR